MGAHDMDTTIVVALRDLIAGVTLDLEPKAEGGLGRRLLFEGFAARADGNWTITKLGIEAYERVQVGGSL